MLEVAMLLRVPVALSLRLPHHLQDLVSLIDIRLGSRYSSLVV